ncbi:hypothetical protein [Armatimonas sp.]|uniref:hypothetical protein n=1 Tax=Armatimonas sp. TaxID=1872638 RepID=UPI00374FECEE
MAYSEFNLQTVIDRFGLTVQQETGHFAVVPPLATISSILKTLLAEQVPLAIAINTEKARSEMIVVNVLAELRRQFPDALSLFSGVELDVEKSESLNGYCDFLISLSPQQLIVSAPIVTLVEAKNADLPAAWGQCVAEMLAAQRFNKKRGNEIPKIYGVVTSGTSWMFGFLEDTSVVLDLQEYGIDEPEKILGVLSAMVGKAPLI